MIPPPGYDASDDEVLEYARLVREARGPKKTQYAGPWPSRFTEPIGLNADGSINVVKDGQKLVPVLSDAQVDRAHGVLLGMACGDALGVPYEFGRPPVGEPQMLGGGLGDYQPGEGSDDSQMAMLIATAVLDRADLATEDGLDRVAIRFIGWALNGPPDIGTQTQAVLSGAARQLGLEPGSGVLAEGAARACRASAWLWHAETGRSAGNGALMRTAPVALPYLLDAAAGASAARSVAGLTHHDPQAATTCVIVGEAIRRAVVDGSWEPLAGVDLLLLGERGQASAWVEEALAGAPGDFADDGYTVRTMQGALAAVHSSRGLPTAEQRFRAAVASAVRGGGDTDTVAAVAGAMAGALDGHAAIPDAWRDAVHVRVNDAFELVDARFGAGSLMAMAGSIAPLFG